MNPAGTAGDIIFNGDGRVLEWCDGLDWFAAGLISPAGPNAGCTNPTASAGKLVFNSDFAVLQYCDGDTWRAVGKLIDPCDGTPAIGTICADSTIYAGLSPDGNVQMFVMPADAPGNYTWNNGSTSWTDTLFTSSIDGDGNTAGLAALPDAGSPYLAAKYCADLSAFGHDDWYLPAWGEWSGSGLGSIVASGGYWLSTEWSSMQARMRANTKLGEIFNPADKNLPASVRCVRK
jgi:hypothetical protein